MIAFCEVGCVASGVGIQAGREFEIAVALVEVRGNRFAPREVFVDLGLAIKRGSPFARTLVIELCNDNPAYIPTKKAFVEGSYETVNSLIEPGGGEALVETALRLLKELKAAE